MIPIEIPPAYVATHRHTKGHWSVTRAVISCDACVMDRHHHRVNRPLSLAHWRYEIGDSVMYLCRPHALEAWSARK